jgi:hypothetical protein
VKIYRFVTKDTYESYMLDVASKKLGLNTVILGRGDADDENEAGGMNPEEISHLLKYGAYNLFNSTEEDDEEKERKMLNEDIESIIQRSATISYGQDDDAKDVKDENENENENEDEEAITNAGKQRARANAAMKVNREKERKKARKKKKKKQRKKENKREKKKKRKKNN